MWMDEQEQKFMEQMFKTKEGSELLDKFCKILLTEVTEESVNKFIAKQILDDMESKQIIKTPNLWKFKN